MPQNVATSYPSLVTSLKAIIHLHHTVRGYSLLLIQHLPVTYSPILTFQEYFFYRIVQVPHQEYAGPRRSYAKARIRTQNALVTNNTVQAIASPTVEHHRNLLQQHE
jgi:hypothetical protein